MNYSGPKHTSYRDALLQKRSLFEKIKSELFMLAEFIAVNSPHDFFGRRLRNAFYARFYKVGSNVNIFPGARLNGRNFIEIGHNFTMASFAEINSGPDDVSFISIGNNVGIARGTFILNANHRFDSVDIPIIEQGHTYGLVKNENGKDYGIVIEDDVWIAANVVILTGSHIGQGAVIGANSVVSGKIPPYSIVLGNPGRIIGNRKKNAAAETANG
jgi:acetyltransferase-like isoleucine patch superfamily enzyme